MATGNTPALLEDQTGAVVDPNGQQQQTGQDGASPGLTFTHPQPPEDADDIELKTLVAAAEAEEAEAKGAGQDDPNRGKDPATGTGTQQQKDQQTAGQPAGDQHMIPKPRFDALLAERDQLREERAYYRGAAEAAAKLAPQGNGQQQQQQPAAPTLDQQLASVRQEKLALASKFDDGSITYTDLKTQEAALDDKEQDIREGMLLAKVKPAAPQQQQQPQGDPLYLDTLTEKLETEHPWVTTFSEFADKTGDETEWNFLTSKARANLEARGVNLKGGTDVAKYHFRKEIAVLADQYGPTLLGDRAAKAGIKLPGTQQQTQQPTQLSPQAAARKAGLEKARSAPPDLAAMNGSVGDTSGTMSDERVEALSEDEFDKMPAAVRNKLLGISP